MSIPTSFNPMGTLGGGLPPGYTLLKCLVAHGTEYVDTGISEYVNFAVEFEVNLSRGDRILGAGVGENPGLSLRVGNVAGTSRFGGSSCILEATVPVGRRATVKADPVALSIFENGEIIATKGWGGGEKNHFTTAASLKLFASVNAAGKMGDAPAIGKGYGAKAWSGTSLIMDLVPALNPDGEPVMYDLVNRVERPNIGTGNFGYETL